MRLDYKTRLFAKRYLFSPKSHSVMNLISIVSVIAVAVPVAAMIVILSVHNGLGSFIEQMYAKFDPPLSITVKEGKFFERNNININSITKIDGVEAVTEILDENVLFGYKDMQIIGVIRGVDSVYRSVIPIEEMVVHGNFGLKHGDLNNVVVGMGIAYNLRVNINLYDKLSVYTPAQGSAVSFLPGSSYKKGELFPVGVFTIDQETDGQYVFAPIDFVRELLSLDGKVSSLGVKVKDGFSESEVARKVKEIAGNDFNVKDRHQQKETLFQIMRYEKIGVYFIMLLVLAISSFTLIGTLIMLMTEKQQECYTLSTMGAEPCLIRNIFMLQGVYISGTGMVLGVILGVVVTLLQQFLGIVSIDSTSLLIDAYPVELRFSDVVLVTISVAIVNYIISTFTVNSMMRRFFNNI